MTVFEIPDGIGGVFRIEWLHLIVITVPFLLAGLSFLAGRRPQISPKAPPLINEGLPIFGAVRFWTERWDFFRWAQTQNTSGYFSFFIGNHPVVGLSGDEGRKVFFESKQFGLTEGYSVLFGMFPSTKVENKEGQDTYHTTEFALHFKDRITRMVRKERVEKNLPILIADTRARLDELVKDPTRITDPFESIYKLIYLLTMRTVGCNELSRNRQQLDTSLGLYETVARCATIWPIVLPWFPSPNLVKRTIAGARLYFLLSRIVSKRIKNGIREDDPLQDMIDRGDEKSHIIGTIMGALFAAQQNSGINAAYVLVYLSCNPDWATKARNEALSVAQKYCPDEKLSVADRLAKVPVEAWESEFSTIELCLRDSIRMHSLGACFRKNISGKDVDLGNGIIPNEYFASYHISNVHLNPEIYRDPEQWDPSRYLPERAEDKKRPLAWLGWGAGRHPCLGMKFAKLEQNIVAAFFLTMFDFQLSDSKGNPLDSPPKLDKNAYSSWKPETPVFLKYNPRT